LIIANEACKPIEVMVPVPQPRKRRALAFPVYVKLFRCSGGCDIEPRLSQCVPTGWSSALFPIFWYNNLPGVVQYIISHNLVLLRSGVLL
jgi:hypothetical protein